jgi:MFS family permease
MTLQISRFLRRPTAATLLTYHNSTYMLASSLASGFVGAFLLRDGISLPVVLLLYAATYLVRYIFRLSVLPVVRRAGFRSSIMLGMGIIALQYLPLAWADKPRWLALWILCRALGEAIYWPAYHAAVAVAGSVEKRGRDLGLRAALTAIGSILGPLAGGFMIATLGSASTFVTGFVISALAIVPVLFCREFAAGRVPGVRETLGDVDALGFAMFFTDGWMSAGWLIMWPLIYFLILGSHYETFGMANAAAGLVGLVVSLVGGRWIDRRRHDSWQLAWVCVALVGSIMLRATASWWPLGGTIANLSGCAMSSAYLPLIMSAMYDRAKRSPNAFQFHLAIEGAWDSGSMTGLLVGAALAWAAIGRVSLVVLPALFGVVSFAYCMRRERHHVNRMAPVDPIDALQPLG